MELSIIIPSYNTRELLKNCIESLYHCTSTVIQERMEIIVVDNSSTDGSMIMIKENFPKVRLVENTVNLGFARAINQGLERAQGKYLLLLNSDTVIDNRAIDKMIAFLESHLEVGVVGCQLKNPDGTIQPSGGYLPNLVRVFFWMSFLDDLPILKNILKSYHVENKEFYTHQRYLGWVTGAFFLTKREVFEKVGFFDETMFMYVEEVDWCQRVEKAGFRVAFDPKGRVIHYKSASTKRGKAGILEEYQGLKYYFAKHRPFWQLAILRFFLKIGALARIIIFGIILKELESRKIYAKAARMA